MSELAKVKHETVSFDALMVNIRDGKIRIPDFQREFVWELSQIMSLLDSIYRHYPIGSFLFWQTDDEIQAYRRIGEVELRHDQEKSVQFVLDGQQRLTSLFASLKQASIAHTVNGKGITKSILIYFDLDENEFVANPFDDDEAKKVYKKVTFASFPEANYFEFLDNFLRWIDKEKPTRKDSVQWLAKLPGMAIGRARTTHAQTRDMGLFEQTETGCQLTDLGREQIGNTSPDLLVESLYKTIEFFDWLLPKVLEDGRAELIEMTNFLSAATGEELKAGKTRARLRWLAGLGLGTFDEAEFVLNDDGRTALEKFFRGVEIRERDKKEQEEEKRKRYFSVRQITDLDQFVETAANLDSERRKRLQKVLSRFSSYPFSIIQVLEQPIETACEIFERVNNSGKALNVVDLMVAKSWSKTFNLRERLKIFRKELKQQDYDNIPDIVILQCLSAIVNRGIRRKEILGTDREVVEENWEATLENIKQAIDFLKNNVKVTHAKILPFNALLVPLAFYFSVVSPKEHSNDRRKQLETWFWRASVSNRYEAALESKIADDISEMAKFAVGDIPEFDYVAPVLTKDRIAAQKLYLGSAFCKTLLCVLNHSGPREFKDSTPVGLSSFSKFNSMELHHIFPKAYLKHSDNDNYPERDSIANIALARASANKEYSSKPPSEYLSKCGNDILDTVLESHLINDTDDSGVFDDDFNTFIEYRSEQMLQEIRRLTGEMTEIEADVAESELGAVESFELKLRELIHEQVSNSNPDYWEKTAPPDFRERIEGRIAGWVKASPGRTRSDAREVDFLQMYEYFKVIKGNWSEFKEQFRSRTDLEQHIKAIADFRNALAHNRDIDTVTRQLAIAALAWFNQVFVAAGADA